MNYLSIISLFIFCLMLSFNQVRSEDTKISEKVNISTSFELGVLNDGKLSNDKLIVELKLFDHQDKINVEWRHVYFKLFEDSGMGVRIQHFTTLNDTITDLEMSENSFEFTLHYDIEASLKIVGTRTSGSYHIEGVGLWWSAIFEKWVTVEWYSIDKETILPLREVFLINL